MCYNLCVVQYFILVHIAYRPHSLHCNLCFRLLVWLILWNTCKTSSRSSITFQMRESTVVSVPCIMTWVLVAILLHPRFIFLKLFLADNGVSIHCLKLSLYSSVTRVFHMVQRYYIDIKNIWHKVAFVCLELWTYFDSLSITFCFSVFVYSQ